MNHRSINHNITLEFILSSLDKKKKIQRNIMNVFFPSAVKLTLALVLIEMVLLSIYNICSGRDLNLYFGCSKEPSH